MRAVVTGGGGFIGSHLIEALVARGIEVLCVERPGALPGWIDGLPIRYVDHGVNDLDGLTSSCLGADVVFHLAGLTEARVPADFYRVNTEGTECVLKAAAAHNGTAPHVILLSSLAATGPCRNGEALSPDSVPFPLSHYGHSKLLAEAVMHAYADRVPGTIFRLPSVYGPRERGVFTFFKLVRRGLALTVGSWDRQLSLIYVKDVVQGLIAAAMDTPPAVRTYCLAHPEPVSWREFARAAQERWVCDSSRANVEIGFEPHYPIASGIAETVAWYREAQWLR
jgi:nucleoside-diphosphate-sugar epimerase